MTLTTRYSIRSGTKINQKNKCPAFGKERQEINTRPERWRKVEESMVKRKSSETRGEKKRFAGTWVEGDGNVNRGIGWKSGGVLCPGALVGGFLTKSCQRARGQKKTWGLHDKGES